MRQRCAIEAFRSLLVSCVILACVTTVSRVSSADDRQVVPYPEGFRSWVMVKSLVVGPDHATFPNRGGIHHYYANEKAVIGYKTGAFPNGSIVVDEAVFTKDGDGPAKGILFEGERRFLDVMVKDARSYEGTGGWGYEHFE